MTVVDALNGFAERGCAWAAASLVEASVLLALAGLVLWLAGRRVSPAAAHLLLLAVLVKAILPLGIPAPRIELPEWSERTAIMETTPQQAVASSEKVTTVDEAPAIAIGRSACRSASRPAPRPYRLLNRSCSREVGRAQDLRGE